MIENLATPNTALVGNTLVTQDSESLNVVMVRSSASLSG
jgi:hypothetical protein